MPYKERVAVCSAINTKHTTAMSAPYKIPEC